MTYGIEELTYTDNTLSAGTPQPIRESDHTLAIVIHVFYIDVFQEIDAYLQRIQTGYDLYLTVPDQMPEDEIKKLFTLQPHAYIYRTENRGRDVLPFLQVMHLIGTDTYRYLCKLHTKKTAGSMLGTVWRKLLYFDLIGSDETVKEIMVMFDQDDTIGMVTGKNTILDSERYDYGNTAKIDYLVETSGFIFQDEYLFAGGTMFWVRPSLIEPLLSLFRAGKLPFEPEQGQKDNTIAHAIERFFGIICHVKGMRIVPSPSHYSELDDATLEETASLVLSQQYHGKDVFTVQNQNLQKLYAKIDLLEHEIESKKLKTRLRKVLSIPYRIAKILKTLIKNPTVLKKVWFYIKRGEIRYLLSKVKEKTRRNLKRNSSLPTLELSRYFKRFKQRHYPTGEHVFDIIIPVYNGYQFLEPLFDSLEKHTTVPHRLIVVNDASPDERVRPYLKTRLQKHPTALFIDHEENRGFVKSVNEARTHAKDHFVILNTDTELPAFWLERLMYPIVHMEKIASTTPFTNAGEIASFPEFLVDNAIFENLQVDELDKVFRDVNAETFYEAVPTGVGFCMGVNFALTEEIGFFEEEAFGKGYGEENDWCQRAIAHGYTNLIVPNLFVYHKHGGSFSAEEKAKLMQHNAIKLLERHPNYDRDIQAYIQRDPHKHLRNILVIAASSKKGEGIDLIVDHALGGGANQYSTKLFEQKRLSQKKVLHLKYDFYAGSYQVYFRYKTYQIDFEVPSFEGIEALLKALKIHEIFVNSLVSFRETNRFILLIKELSEISNADIVIPIHDFYPVCPNFTLLNEKSQFCGVPSLETCQRCMKHNDLEWKTFGNEDVDVAQWRETWNMLLSMATEIICFSNSSKEILLKAYPSLPTEIIHVTPHDVPPLPFVPAPPQKRDNKVIIGILGAINHAKGAHIIKDLVDAIEKRDLNIDIVLIGETSEYIKSRHFKKTGAYQRGALPKLVEEHEIDIFLIPSICPETFSYTTQEIIMMQMPLMVFNIGAPAERVSRYEKGVVLEPEYVESILQYISSLNNS